MDAFIQIADAIKRDVGEIITRNLERDETYRHEVSSARTARWNRAKIQIGKVIDYNLIVKDGLEQCAAE